MFVNGFSFFSRRFCDDAVLNPHHTTPAFGRWREWKIAAGERESKRIIGLGYVELFMRVDVVVVV